MHHVFHKLWPGVFGALAVLAPALAPADESVLLWDEGVGWGPPAAPDHYLTGQVGMMEAVHFEASVSSHFLVAIMLFTGEHPSGELVGSTGAATDSFRVHVWSPNGDSMPKPGADAIPSFHVPGGYPALEWIRVDLPEPLCLDDVGLFPEGDFFVGIEWAVHNSPPIGLDFVGSVDYRTWRLPWYLPWEMLMSADLMLRAVVSDSLDTIVQPASWGTIKGSFS